LAWKSSLISIAHDIFLDSTTNQQVIPKRLSTDTVQEVKDHPGSYCSLYHLVFFQIARLCFVREALFMHLSAIQIKPSPVYVVPKPDL